MSLFRLPYVLSLLLHGAAIGTACALGGGAAAPPRAVRIELQPSEAAVAMTEAPPPLETFEVEAADDSPLLQEPTEPEQTPVASDEFAAHAEPQFVPVAASEPTPDWLAVVVPPRSASLEPVEPAPLHPPSTAAVLDVIPGDNPPPEYPSLARRQHWQGVVVISVRVAADGGVTSAVVARSSGHALLDAAAIKAVRDWRFRGGPGETTVEVEFVLRTP